MTSEDALSGSIFYDPLGGAVSKTETLKLLTTINTPSDIGDFDAYRNEMIARGRDITVEGSMRWVLRADFITRCASKKIGEDVANLVFDMWSKGGNTAEINKVQAVIDR